MTAPESASGEGDPLVIALSPVQAVAVVVALIAIFLLIRARRAN